MYATRSRNFRMPRGANHSCLHNHGRRALVQIRVLAGVVARGQRQTINRTVGYVFDFGDMLDVVVGITNAPQDPEAERQRYQEHDP